MKSYLLPRHKPQNQHQNVEQHVQAEIQRDVPEKPSHIVVGVVLHTPRWFRWRRSWRCGCRGFIVKMVVVVIVIEYVLRKVIVRVVPMEVKIHRRMTAHFVGGHGGRWHAHHHHHVVRRGHHVHGHLLHGHGSRCGWLRGWQVCGIRSVRSNGDGSDSVT